MYNDGVKKMLTNNKDLSDAYNDVIALKMSMDEFNESIKKFGDEHPLISLTYNKALIPNKKACTVSSVAATMCNMGNWSFCLGYIGVWVHC